MKRSQVSFVLIVLAFVLVVLAIFAVSDTPAVTPAEPAPKQSFEDVPLGHWAYDEIELIFSHGITVGCSYDPPLYCPDRPATRAEMAVFAARLIELMEDK